MRSTISLKLLAASCLACLTCVVTDSILAQQPNTLAETSKLITSKTFVDKVPIAFAPALPAARIQEHESGSVKRFGIDVDEKTLVVHATVEMMSRSPMTAFHIWRLKIIDLSTDTVVLDVPYHDQRFQIHESGQMSPQFNERIPLAAGKYQVRLQLLKIPDGVLVEDLLDGVDNRGLQMYPFGFSKLIEVP